MYGQRTLCLVQFLLLDVSIIQYVACQECIIPLREVFITADVSTLARITAFARLGMTMCVSVC